MENCSCIAFFFKKNNASQCYFTFGFQTP
ncbi:unnamed protein product [Spirodela intermedia]|uniref:Uncharacterized protein n=1 Tax=Spirodela intermedia TaxID=51605 RepID=A0A7I8I954_SPIIN|nr:unnamed protein product [Spirodela intermedia]CAA6654014.1 unnamed protein product [Spirodela intermedia]